MTRITCCPGIAHAALLAILSVACNNRTSATPTSPTSTAESAQAIVSSMAAATSCATGDGVNDACSCDADAQASCSGFYSANWVEYARAHGYVTSSWKYGLLDCLGKHTLSTACEASLDRRETLNAAMMSACGAYCRGVTPRPGAEPCVDHLKSIYSSLDASCRSALDAHEGAKAVDGR